MSSFHQCVCGRRIVALMADHGKHFAVHAGPGSEGRPYRCEIDLDQYILHASSLRKYYTGALRSARNLRIRRKLRQEVSA